MAGRAPDTVAFVWTAVRLWIVTIFVFVMLLWGQAQAAACAPDDVTASCIFVRPMYATFGPWAWAGVAVMTVMSLLVTGVLVVRGTRR